jgi:hypothetical protein
MCRLSIDASALPDITKPEMDFLDASFFRSVDGSVPQLPSPTSIIKQHGDGASRVIVLVDLSMAVKVGDRESLRLEEVQAMRATRQVFPHGEVPIPEVFGWRRHNQQLFVYMSLIHGSTLRNAWPSLTDEDKKAIQIDLRSVVSALRRISQDNPQNIGASRPNLRTEGNG